jgi:hypothetical protein
MARDPRTPDCAIKGCTRAADRSGLCGKHHKYVPHSMAMELSVAIMQSAHKIAQQHHSRWQRFVQAEISAGREWSREAGYMPAAHAFGVAASRSKG